MKQKSGNPEATREPLGVVHAGVDQPWPVEGLGGDDWIPFLVHPVVYQF